MKRYSVLLGTEDVGFDCVFTTDNRSEAKSYARSEFEMVCMLYREPFDQFAPSVHVVDVVLSKRVLCLRLKVSK